MTCPMPRGIVASPLELGSCIYVSSISSDDVSPLASWCRSASAGVARGTPHGGLPCEDRHEPRISPAKQDLLRTVSEGFVWSVTRAWKARRGTARDHKTMATGRQYAGVSAHHFGKSHRRCRL